MDYEVKIDSEEYNNLLKNYENSSIKICIEKCCDYKFIFFLNNEATLNDLYIYVTTFYTHVTEPILLYLDKRHKNLIPNNRINLKNYFRHNNILTCTKFNLPTVYKLYINLCFEHKNLIL
tara:strand:- start:13 stop:372 length:360 start_codon:yes stop_codon:yes gene_type:complete